MVEATRFDTLIQAGVLREWLTGKSRFHGSALALIDCRFDLMDGGAGRRCYLEAHLPGAQHADLDRDLSAPVDEHGGRHPLPDPTVFAATLARWGIRPGVQVVAYDASGGTFAARLWWMLRAWRHEKAAVLDGGFRAWIAAGGETTSGGTTKPGGTTTPGGAALGGAAVGGETTPGGATPADRPPPPPIAAWPVISTAEVAELRQDARRLLVDARAPERFSGASEPIDAVAGHVPGAVNHPTSLNLGTDGRFLPAAELRRRWQERLGEREPAQVVAMCGSGVTACHDLLALEIAGLGGAQLYLGSWSEWIRDPRRPVARGNQP